MIIKRQKTGSVRFKHPYDRFNSRDLIIRDYLAIQRTNLANERTFLAYVRTSVGLLIVGVSFIKFSDSKILFIIGIALIAFSVVSLVVGLINYFRRKRQIPHLKELEGEERLDIPKQR